MSRSAAPARASSQGGQAGKDELAEECLTKAGLWKELRDRLRGWPPRAGRQSVASADPGAGSAGAGALLPVSLALLSGAAEAGDALTDDVPQFVGHAQSRSSSPR